MNKLAPFLWFNDNAEEAAAFYLSVFPHARKLNELRRMGRRLAELGAVLFTTATEPTAISACVDDFFAIEARRGKKTKRAHDPPVPGTGSSQTCGLPSQLAMAAPRGK